MKIPAHVTTIKDLVKRQIISPEVGERLALLPEERINLTLAVLVIDLPGLRREHVDLLIESADQAQFEKSLRKVKREISIPTIDLYAVTCYSSLIRFLSALRETSDYLNNNDRYVKFIIDKIIATAWRSLSFSNHAGANAETHKKRFLNTINNQ